MNECLQSYASSATELDSSAYLDLPIPGGIVWVDESSIEAARTGLLADNVDVVGQ